MALFLFNNLYIFFFVEINYAAEKPEFPDYKLYKAQRINQVFSLSNPPKVGAVLYAASAGGYALYLAEKMSPGGTLYVVDPWPNEKDYLKFLKNVALLNKQLVVHPIRMDVCDAGNALSATGAHVDFVFWDGEGSEERIKEQLESWWPLLAPDGVMVGDDYYSESIVGAVNRFNASISGTLETPAIWPTAPFKLWRISKGDRLEASSVGKRALDHFLTQYTPFTFGCGIMKGVGKDLGFPHQARIEEFNLLRSAFLNRFRAASEDQPPSTEIPRVHHSIWLTNIANPKDLYCQKRANGEKLWKYYEISLRKFEKKNGWTHVLWCLFPEQMPEMVELANEWGVEVRSIYDPQWGLYQKMPARHIFDAYLVDNHFSLAGNVLREAILYVYGGLYRDIAVELNFDPALMFSLCGAETFYASRTQRAGEQFDYLDQDICASAPGGRIPGKFLENIDTLYKGKAPAAGEENSVSAVFRRHFVDNCRAHIELVRPSQIMLAATQVCAEVGVAETGLVWGNDVSDMGIDGGKKLFTRHGNSSWRHRLWGCEKADESKVNLFNVVPFPYYEKISLAHHNSIRQAVVSTELQKIWQEQGAEKAEAGTENHWIQRKKPIVHVGKHIKIPCVGYLH
ncbi:MAG: class I SAM-dependent methyltransferase [Holosporaceae bacterium]|nr:MAG: class I SAM-dependent methyltransferase [Holosporaceae bacterium]